MQYIPFLVLAGILVYREWQHHKEILDLSAKIKAANLAEYQGYKAAEQSNSKPDNAPVTEPVPFEDLEPDKALSALESDLAEAAAGEDED